MTLEVLTTGEHETLAQCEEAIKAGMSQFIRVGEALAMVRNGRLYRAEFETFESYCGEKWQLTSRRCNQIIESAKVAKELPMQLNERQASALALIRPEMRLEVLNKLKDTGKLTASRILAAAGQKTRRTDTEPTPNGKQNFLASEETFEDVIEAEFTRLADLIEQFPDAQHLDVIDENLKYLRGRIEELKAPAMAA